MEETKKDAMKTLEFVILDTLISNSFSMGTQELTHAIAEQICLPEFRWALELLSQQEESEAKG